MSEYDQRRLFDNENAQSNRAKGQALSTQKDSEPYNTDHLPKLSKDSPALNFKPMEDIQKKASLDKQTLLIIENGATKIRGWQLTKTEFINQVKAMVDSKVNGLLKHVGFTTDDCPWLKAFYAELGTYPAQGIEQILRQYLPQGQTIESTNDFLTKLGERIEVPIKHWIKTRKIQDVPELVEKKIAETQPGGNTNGHFDPFTAAKQSTTSIPPELKGKLEEYLGASLSSIRLHTGTEAEKVLAQKKARAFTLGQDIFLDLKQYSLESPKGMAILAHEIVHAMQQMGATSMDASNNSDALEADANRSVWGLLRRWMQWGKGFAAAGANMKSGLKVAKCSLYEDEEVTEPVSAHDLIEPGIIDSKEKNGFSEILLKNHFRDRGNERRANFHSQGDYEPLMGVHTVENGNILRTIALRYYGDYIYKDGKNEIDEDKMSNVLWAMSVWHSETGRGSLESVLSKMKASYKDVNTYEIKEYHVVVNPFVYRRWKKTFGAGKDQRSEFGNFSKDTTNLANINYALFYTHQKASRNEKTNLKHVFISIAKFNKGTKDKTEIKHEVKLDNKDLSLEVKITVNGKKQDIHLDFFDQIVDDLLWSIVTQFKYEITQDRHHKILLEAEGEEQILETYKSLMNPINDTQVKENALKDFLVRAGQVGSGAGLAGLFKKLVTSDVRIKVFFYALGLIGSFIPTELESKQIILYATHPKDWK